MLSTDVSAGEPTVRMVNCTGTALEWVNKRPTMAAVISAAVRLTEYCPLPSSAIEPAMEA